MLSERLRGDEWSLTKRAVKELSSAGWAQPLLRRFEQAGGMCHAAKPIMFEVRYAYELHRAGIEPVYEQPTGAGESRVDFLIPANPPWLVELVSIGVSDAVKASRWQSGLFTGMQLGNDPDHPERSEAGEIIKVQEKIAAKARKFPAPADARHMILVDMRAYLDNGGDRLDYREMMYGWYGVPRDMPFARHEFRGERIRGLMETDARCRDAKALQSRVHFIGFVTEKRYGEGEIRRRGYHLANWHLFADDLAAQDAFRPYPMRPID